MTFLQNDDQSMCQANDAVAMAPRSNVSLPGGKIAYSVDETARFLSIGRTKLYALVGAGDLRITKLGRKTLFLANDIEAFVGRLQRGEVS